MMNSKIMSLSLPQLLLITVLLLLLLLLMHIIILYCRSQWPRGLRRRSAAARLLRSWVRIPTGAWMFVCCECCVLSGRGLCDELITRLGESYRLWCVVVCDLETSRMRRPWPALGRSATEKKSIINTQNNYYVSNKGHLDECDTEENLEVTGLLLLPAWKEDCKTLCPMPRIGPVTARLARHW